MLRVLETMLHDYLLRVWESLACTVVDKIYTWDLFQIVEMEQTQSYLSTKEWNPTLVEAGGKDELIQLTRKNIQELNVISMFTAIPPTDSIAANQLRNVGEQGMLGQSHSLPSFCTFAVESTLHFITYIISR